MAVIKCSWIVLSILIVEGITCHLSPPINPNNHLYNVNYNRNYNGNYNMNPGIVRYPEVGVRPGELIAEVNDTAEQTPCRNKETNKQHKDSLWWTLPIPPSELEESPEKPPQIKQPEPPPAVQQMETSLKPLAAAYIKTGTVQQKHLPTSTAIVQAAPAVVATAQAVSQVIPTGRHESSTLYKQEKSRVAQKQQGQGAGGQATLQNSVPVPSQLVVSNKEKNQLTSNKSLATVRALGRVVPPVNSHGTNKPKAKLNMNLMDGAGCQYGDEGLAMSPVYLNYPDYNMQYQREPQLDAAENRGYRSDVIDSISALRDNIYNNFDSNEAELGGANVVGESKPYESKQIPMLVNEHNFAPISQQVVPVHQGPIDSRR